MRFSLKRVVPNLRRVAFGDAIRPMPLWRCSLAMLFAIGDSKEWSRADVESFRKDEIALTL